MMDAREKVVRQKLKDDLAHYTSRCLMIRTKGGEVIRLDFNKAQKFLHGRLEAQKEQTGMVRALVLKGRQQGISTYIGARYYHRATHWQGQRVFILTHEQEATDNLFDMVQRYHEYCPALIKPQTGSSNAKELDFDKISSGYKVGTAGTKAVGRSQTVQLFHGSEVAFWPHAETHASGILQALPDLPGTESILESTANGMGSYFHQKWQEAEAGEGDYIAVFIPWYWQTEYVRPANTYMPEGDDEEYRRTMGLTAEQMAFRQAKIIELGDPLLFKQEYPATAAEAFQITGHDSVIKAGPVMAARKAHVEGIGELVVGADPARYGDDSFALCWRKGREISKVERKSKLSIVEGANWIRKVIDDDDPAAVFVDVGGLGSGVVDILHDWGKPYSRVVIPINFGSEPQDPVEIMADGKKKPGPRNRRAEMWMRSKTWLDDVRGADIPDDDMLHADACGPGYTYDLNQRLLLESKEKMRSRGVKSPDGWDSVVLTFAEPPPARATPKPKQAPVGAGGWMA